MVFSDPLGTMVIYSALLLGIGGASSIREHGCHENYMQRRDAKAKIRNDPNTAGNQGATQEPMFEGLETKVLEDQLKKRTQNRDSPRCRDTLSWHLRCHLTHGR